MKYTIFTINKITLSTNGCFSTHCRKTANFIQPFRKKRFIFERIFIYFLLSPIYFSDFFSLCYFYNSTSPFESQANFFRLLLSLICESFQPLLLSCRYYHIFFQNYNLSFHLFLYFP